MLDIRENEILTPYTTLKIGSKAEFFVVVKKRQELLEAIVWARDNKKKISILGSGSNLLISKKVAGLVIKNEIKGIKMLASNETEAVIEAKSGELWSRFVSFAVDQHLYGVENLFLIPGTVGAAAIQNIGAYGVELKDVLSYLIAINLNSGRSKAFCVDDCRLAYRDSIFKNSLGGKYFIYSVVLKLSKKEKFKLDYGSIKNRLKSKGVKKITLAEVIAVIQELRNSKLPNPVLIPNAGSFFKNPELNKIEFKKIQKKYPHIPHFPASSKTKIKIPAAWLIEQAGFKGKRFGSVGMYEKQALILVNYGQATASQALALVKKIKAKVKKDFKLDLEEEVNII